MNILPKIIPALWLIVTLPSLAGEAVEQSLSANEVSQINIENLRGKVRVIGWDNTDVRVKGELEDDAERLVFEKNDNSIKIKVVVPRHSNNNWGDKGSELIIHTPKNIRVNFDSVASDVDLENLQAGVEVKTVSGHIVALHLSDHIELSSVSGDVTSQMLSGKIYLSTVSGDIKDRDSSGRLQLKGVSGEIDSISTAKEVIVNNVSGDISLKLENIDELKMSNISGDSQASLSLNDNGLTKFSSISGNLSVAFQNDIQASFRLVTNSGGKIVNKITQQKAQQAKYGPSSKLRFETGNANGVVKASTISGQIKVSH